MTHDLGDKIRLSYLAKDLAGALVNTPTVTIAVVKPDGTAVTPAPTVVNTGANGLYTADIPAATVNQAGWWTYAWTASGTVEATDDGQVEVAADRVLVASVEELKAHLRFGTDVEDAKLRDVLTAVTDLIEPSVGYVTARTVTEWHTLDGTTVAPRRRPLVSVTSLTRDQGAAVDPAQYLVDTELGLVRLRTWLRGRYELVYRAGHAVWPRALKWAGLIICQHEWAVRNGTGGRPSPDADALAMLPGTGFLVPNRALELMRPYLPVLVA